MMGEAIEVEVDAAAAAPPSTLQVPSGDESDVHQRQIGDFSQSDHRRKVKKRHIVGGLVALLAVILAVVLGVTLSKDNSEEASGGERGSSEGTGGDNVGTPEDIEDGDVALDEDLDAGDLDEELDGGMQEVPWEDLDEDNTLLDGDMIASDGSGSGFQAVDDTFAFSLDIFQELGAESIYVLDNDIGGEATIQITQQATHGSCIVDFDLQYIIYTPRAGDEFYVGTDECTYEACLVDDPEQCDTAALTIEIEEGDVSPPPPTKPALSEELILDDSIELISDPDEMRDAVVAIYGDTAIVGSPNYDGTKGIVIVFVKDENGEWDRQATLIPDNPEDYQFGTNFGWSVDIFGDTILVGAWGDTDDENFEYNKGAAHVFVREGDTWSYQAKLAADDAGDHDFFGGDVAVHGDTAIVSATWDDDGGDDSGAVYVFERDASGAWSQQSKLVAPDSESYDNFGNSVAIDGATIVIGAFWDDDVHMDQGAAYVWERDGDGWTYQQKLQDNTGQGDDRFGNLVALDGDIMVIGARGVDDDEGRTDIGAAHVFVRDASGWTQQAKLESPDGAMGDEFGNSVDISSGTILVAARFDDDSGEESGSVHIYVSDGDGGWEHQAKLLAPAGEQEDFFGYSTRIDDGTIVVGSKSGEMHVFEY